MQTPSKANAVPATSIRGTDITIKDSMLHIRDYAVGQVACQGGHARP